MKKNILFLFSFAMLFSSCSNDDDNTDRDSSGDKIYPVYIKLSAEDMRKKPFGMFLETDSTKTGKGGVKLFNDSTSYGIFAFDLACSIEWNEVEINSVVNGSPGTDYFICNSCKSTYLRYTGVAYSGIAKEQNKNLKRYQVVKQSNGNWLISN